MSRRANRLGAPFWLRLVAAATLLWMAAVAVGIIVGLILLGEALALI